MFKILICFVFILFSNSLFAQSNVHLKIQVGGVNKIALKVATFTSANNLSSWMKYFSQLAIDDLSFSNRFFFVDSFPEFSLTANLESDKKNNILEVKIYKTGLKESFFEKKYQVVLDRSVELAHQVSDDVIYSITGEQGLGKTKIAYVSGKRTYRNVYVMDFDGRSVRKIVDNKSINLFPRWSPDGNKILFTSYKMDLPDIFLIDLKTNVVSKFHLTNSMNITGAWSPDGKFLAYSKSENGSTNIILTDVYNKTERFITSGTFINSSPNWSPSGNQVAFTSDQSGTPQIYLMSIDGTNLTRLTYNLDYNDSPAWSPKGDKILFVGRNQNNLDIYSIDVMGENLIQLTQNSGNNENPCWSPDGRKIVFSSNRTGLYEIYIMNDDGTDVRRITFSSNSASFSPTAKGSPSLTENSGCWMPSWSPFEK